MLAITFLLHRRGNGRGHWGRLRRAGGVLYHYAHRHPHRRDGGAPSCPRILILLATADYHWGWTAYCQRWRSRPQPWYRWW